MLTFWVAALAVTVSQPLVAFLAANLDQVSEVDLMLAAIPDLDAAVDQSEEPGLCWRVADAPDQTLDQSEDVDPNQDLLGRLEAERGSAATPLAAKRLAAQSLHPLAATLDQDVRLNSAVESDALVNRVDLEQLDA
jgi:hypothetical protein